MKVELEDVLFWMDAIRNSKDRYRTLESFWKGQIRSKTWLVKNLEQIVDTAPMNISIHAGWNGVLASLLFSSEINVSYIESIDIDKECEEIANTICKRQQMVGKFIAKTADILEYSSSQEINLVINTSCEHLNDKDLSIWYNNLPTDSLIICQSNNFRDISEHINCVNSCQELAQKFSNFDTYVCDSLRTEMYTRYMIIGKNAAD